jgi:aminoglycoside phosphotransferase (APT) family kinase protein
MNHETEKAAPLPAPEDTAELLRGEWISLPADDPITGYLATHHWSDPTPPVQWEVARLSQAAYAYRETTTQWAVVGKFYAAKTGAEATEYAARELERIRKAQAAGFGEEEGRVIHPLSLWRGVLFLEYVDGLTLEDLIAVRRSRPGVLTIALERAATFLARLHAQTVQPDVQSDAASQVAYTHKVVDNLVKHGVLANDPVISRGLHRLIDRWADDPLMSDYQPVLKHGDATTTNFVFPWDGGMVVIDWERMYPGDPAADLGRLMAEVAHSITQHGGNILEAMPALQFLTQAYRRSLTGGRDARGVIERAHFYQASSTLRIARNGWVSRLDRIGLVARAMALLS